MNQIKPSTSTQFPIGSKVKITNSGQCYSGYRHMATHMCLGSEWSNGRNPFRNGDVGVVVAKAQHESYDHGDVLAVRVENGIGLMSHKGVVEYEEPVVIGKPKLPEYDLAPLTPDAYDALELRVMNAPSWATHVGSDSCGVHFFDHHPHIYKNSCSWKPSFLKGLLPDTHRAKVVHDKIGATDTLKVMVIQRVEPVDPETTIAELKRELAETKAKLWEAEWKLNKIVDVVQDGIL